METIHFKTVDPISQDLLRRAAGKGIGLNWERYEKQQPQDGFLRLGLCCPYGCLQGPCRIDPFGRGAQSGICGLDRDGMVAATLLRLTLQGALETMALRPFSCNPEIAFPAPLASRAAALGGDAGGQPLSFSEPIEAVRMLARPSASPEGLVRQAIRLALFGVGLQGGEKTESAAKTVCTGYGLLAGEAIRIAVAGRIPQELAEELLKKGEGSPAVQLLSLGDWIPAGEKFLPIVCTSGEAESVLCSGKWNLLIAGEGADPSILPLCDRLKLPVITDAKGAETSEILKRARDAFDRRIPDDFSPDAALIAEGQIDLGGNSILSALKGAASARVSLIGGADTLLHSLGHLPTELAKALRAEELAVASWGDAALWMMKQEIPVALLEAQGGAWGAVRALAEAGRLPSLQGICFTGLRSGREWTLALGLAALGLKVLIATPLAIWGSEKVRTLLRENLAAAGGMLTHFDHPARPDEILEWFLRS